MSKVSPARVTQARELAALTKTEIAEKVGVSPAAVAQWESGAKSPTAQNIAALSSHLKIPIALLLSAKPAELQHRGPLTFRAWLDATTRKANRKAATVAELVAETFFWLEARIAFPSPSIPEIDHETDSESMAVQCRRYWQLGVRPILKLAELLESKGIIVTTTSFGDERFDAFSCIIQGRPFIFLGDEKRDRARSRFDAAHELGHLVMHQHLSENEFFASAESHRRVEQEADVFASAFLLPAETFSRDIVETTLEGFLRLKPKWGVSVQAMVVRAYELGIITESQYRALYRQMGFRGWRKAKREPLDEAVPSMRPTLGRKSLELLEANNVIHAWQIPAELPIPISILSGVFQTNPAELQPIELKNIISFDPYKETTAETDEIANV